MPLAPVPSLALSVRAPVLGCVVLSCFRGCVKRRLRSPLDSETHHASVRGRPSALYRPQLSSAGERGLRPPAQGTGVRPAHAKCILTEQTRTPNPSAPTGKTAMQQPCKLGATRQGQTPPRGRAFEEGMFEIPLDSLPASGRRVSSQLLAGRKRTSGRRGTGLQGTWPGSGSAAEPRALPSPFSRPWLAQSQRRHDVRPPDTRGGSNRIKGSVRNWFVIWKGAVQTVSY